MAEMSVSTTCSNLTGLSLSEGQGVQVSVIDASGNVVRTLIQDFMPSGYSSFSGQLQYEGQIS